MSSVIRSLVVKVGADLSDAQKKLNGFSKDMAKTGKQLSNAGSAMTKSITVPVLAAAGAIGGLAIKAGQTGDELLTMSSQMGITTTTLQKLKYAANFVDVEVEDMAKGMAKVTKEMGAAVKAGDKYIDISDSMKVSIYKSNGELKDSEDLFYDTIDAIGQLGSETEKEIAAQEIFGKSYQDLKPLIDAGSQALEKYGQEAKDLGVILDEETIKEMGKFDDAIQRVKAQFGATASKIGVAFIPVLNKLIPIIEDNIVPLVKKLCDGLAKALDWFADLSPEAKKFIGVLALMAVSIGPVLSGLGSIITTISSLTSIVGLAASPAGIIILGLVAIAAAVLVIAKNWDTIRASAASAVNAVIKGINDIFGASIAYVTWGNSQRLNTFGDGQGRTGGDTNAFYDPNFKGRSQATVTGTTTTSGKPSPIPRAQTYAIGTNYVPETGLAMLHKGEAVIPADANAKGYSQGITINITGNTIAKDYDVERIGNLLVQKLKLAGVRA